jgi:hypothetical protein
MPKHIGLHRLQSPLGPIQGSNSNASHLILSREGFMLELHSTTLLWVQPYIFIHAFPRLHLLQPHLSMFNHARRPRDSSNCIQVHHFTTIVILSCVMTSLIIFFCLADPRLRLTTLDQIITLNHAYPRPVTLDHV